jgi:hypothetical protein
MARFLITYHGGGPMPSDPQVRQQMLDAFDKWASGVGEAMVDPGAPLGPAKAVTSAGVASDPGGVGGYTLVSAASLDEAVGLVRNHPFLSGGGTLRVAEAMTP